MKKRVQATVVVVLAGRVARADFDGAPDGMPARIWQAPRKPGAGLPESVRLALAMGGLSGARTWVLAEDFWAQSLALPTAQTDRLAPQELADALAFEVEPFSNLPPGETAVGVRSGKPADGATPHWVVECPRADLAAIQEIAARAGSRLAGASHPGGLPLPLGEAHAAQPWQRVEKWQSGWLAVTGDGRGAVSVQSFAVSRLGETLAGWTGAAERLAAEAGAWKNLPAEERFRCSLALDDEAGLRRWLAAWFRCLNGTVEKPALLSAPSLPTPLDCYIKVGALAAGAALVLCLLHAAVAGFIRDRAARQAEALRESIGQIEQVERENSALQGEINALRNKRREYEEAAALLARQRQAFPLLLRSLAAGHAPDIVLRELRREGDGRLRIAGLGLTPDAVDVWAGQLSENLRSGGWMVAPAGKSAQGVLDDSGPWHFILRATQTDMADAAGTAAPPAPEEAAW